ncbi:MAG: hypothetical protein ABFD69_05590 [Candidatus Sumerlaeia bacterium]
MRKGFSVTLAMVAFAMLAYNASAYAPTITDLPDIVVGDAEDSSAANVFVFTNAIDLNAKVNDDMTTPAGIIWTYSEADSQYLINKATPSVPGTDNQVSPSAAKRIDNQSDPADTDGPRTATIRDNVRSPYTGTAPYSPSDLNGGILPNSRVITLYASDGSTVSLTNGKSFVVYSLDNGYDAYSPAEDVVYQPPMQGAIPSGWSYQPSAGTATQSFGNDGLCITVGLTGDNDARWQSAYGSVSLAANSVWEARLTVTTSQNTAFAQPLWAMVYDNYGGTGVTGQNEYGGECFFIDNENGANSAIASVGRNGSENFKVFMMPIQEQTEQFSNSTTGFLSPTYDPSNDMRIILRVMDYGSSTYGAATDSGSICWSGLKVVRHDLADMNAVGDPEMNVSTFADGRTTPLTANSFFCEGYNASYFDQTTVTFGATGVTIAPTTNWNSATVLLFVPGDSNAAILGPPATNANINDNYPIAWVADSLYYIEYTLKALDATNEMNPPDVIRVGADEATNEIVFDNFLVPNTPDNPFNTRGLSTPRTGAAQKYACFFYSHSVTKSTSNNVARWRPRLDILCSSSVSPIGRNTNTGSVMVTSMKVQKVNFSN